ncbi:MAG: glycoside hydrolase family 76 protein [Oscillospiraceae bacterium]|nr:glycoside hydrolase family 76 protein [Oscillospiraceae bacterium]
MDKTLPRRLTQAVLNNFYDRERNCLREYAPVRADDRKDSYLWGYFAATGMLYHACRTEEDLKPVYRGLLEGLLYYRSKPLKDGLVKYHSERGDAPDGGHGPCFFDDNIWVARNYLFAYETFGDAFYLAEARRVAAYVYTGWNGALGGLVWNENGLTEHGTVQELERGLSANACGSIVSAMLYRLTGEEGYLDWARQFYTFCKTVQDPVTKIYYNGVHTLLKDGKRLAGEVNKDLYSYNTGSMLLAGLYLYDVTRDEACYADVLAAAKAAHEAFLCPATAEKPAYYTDFDWFMAILAEGYEALAGYDKPAAKKYLKPFEDALTYAAGHFMAENGLLPHDHTKGWRRYKDQEGLTQDEWQKNNEYDRMLLTHSGTAEIAWILAGQSGERLPQRGRILPLAD